MDAFTAFSGVQKQADSQKMEVALAEFTNHDSVDCFVAVVEVLFSLSLLLH